MMTPKEKAKWLVEIFANYTDCAGDTATHYEAEKIKIRYAKQCAIICVNDIISETKSQAVDYKDDFRLLYWQAVKKEIENQ